MKVSSKENMTIGIPEDIWQLLVEVKTPPNALVPDTPTEKSLREVTLHFRDCSHVEEVLDGFRN